MKKSGIVLFILGVLSFIFSFAEAGLVLGLMGIAVYTAKDEERSEQ